VSKITLLNENNLEVIPSIRESEEKFKFIYADMIYENTDFFWIKSSLPLLDSGGVFIVQTDYHTVSEVKQYMDSLGLSLINWCIYVNEWGGIPKKAFPKKHDDILIYSKDMDYKWYPERIQIPKVTAGTVFDKKGTGMKTPPDVFYDKPSFSTMSNERVRFGDTNIRWQKPIWLMERLLLPFTDENDNVLDLFMGSGTLGVTCKKHNRVYVGIEKDTDIFNLAVRRINDGKLYV
jgi:site-specific DNA-methyltransferase (adenine-specific)